MKLLRVGAIAVLAISGNILAAGDPASIAGSVVDDSGDPVQGVTVSVQRVAELTRDSLGRIANSGVRFGTTSQTDANGSFGASGLPSGQYFLCAHPAAPGYLSNCEWTAGALSTEVTEGASLAVAPLVLRKGTVVRIIADDPSGLVQATSGMVAIPGPHHFFPSVKTAAGYFASARQTQQTGSQHIFTVTIPKAVTVELFFDTDLSVAGPAAQSLAADSPSGVMVAGGPDVVTVEVAVK